MNKLLAVLSIFVTGYCFANGMQDSVELLDTDAYGNKIYGVKDAGFIFIDGSATVGRFASISLTVINNTNEAGYAVVPAKSLEEMNDNAQFAKIYTVDCDRQRIINDNGQAVRVSEMNPFHQAAAGVACFVLKN